MEITMDSVLDKDLSKHEESNPLTTELITIATGESGVNPFKTFLDYLKIRKGVGRLRFDEYVSNGFHMPHRQKGADLAIATLSYFVLGNFYSRDIRREKVTGNPIPTASSVSSKG